MKQNLTLIAAALLIATLGTAQISTPAPSPHCELEQAVGLTDITLDYSRPGVKDRTIFAADGLVPYGEIWRTGANAATTIEFSRDVNFAGKEVPAGEYALYTIPNEGEWTVMLYSDLSLGGDVGNYDEANEVMRSTVKANDMGDWKVETFTMDLANISSEGAELELFWENTWVSVPIEVHTHDQVMSEIDKFASNPMADVAGNYLNSGWYIYNSGGDKEKALEYMSAGCQHTTSPYKYFYLARKAQIQADMGDYKAAVETCKAAHKSGLEAPENARGFYDNTVKDELNANMSEWKAKM